MYGNLRNVGGNSERYPKARSENNERSRSNSNQSNPPGGRSFRRECSWSPPGRHESVLDPCDLSTGLERSLRTMGRGVQTSGGGVAAPDGAAAQDAGRSREAVCGAAEEGGGGHSEGSEGETKQQGRGCPAGKEWGAQVACPDLRILGPSGD